MPAIVAKSISILSDAGLGMAMFSLGIIINSYYFISLIWLCFSLWRFEFVVGFV